jgi:MHS family proline/betaine transporter-like MFS transporter
MDKIASDLQSGAPPTAVSIGAQGRRVLVAATIGNMLEWYDFLVFSLLTLTIAKLFFPASSELGSLLLSLATFGVGFVMRPVGAVVLGIYADRIGRKAALSLSIFIMALGTGLIAVAPTYQTAGLWAPLLIVLARACCRASRAGASQAAPLRSLPRPHRNGTEASTRAGSPPARRQVSCSAPWLR